MRNWLKNLIKEAIKDYIAEERTRQELREDQYILDRVPYVKEPILFKITRL